MRIPASLLPARSLPVEQQSTIDPLLSTSESPGVGKPGSYLSHSSAKQLRRIAWYSKSTMCSGYREWTDLDYSALQEIVECMDKLYPDLVYFIEWRLKGG